MLETTALLHLTMPPEPSAVGETVAMLIDALAPSSRGKVVARDVAPEPHEEFRLAVAEAINNVIEHGGHPSERPLRLRAGRAGPLAWVEIEDEGAPLPPQLLEPDRRKLRLPIDDLDQEGPIEEHPLLLDALPESGWGWFLIHASVDRVAHERAGDVNRLRLERRFAP